MATKKAAEPKRRKLKTRKPIPREPVILLVGDHGIGKTTFGAQAPNPTFILTEDGASNMEDVELNIVEVEGMPADDSVVRSWPMFLDALREVLETEHKHESLIVDTINGATSLLAHHVCQNRYGGQWAAVKNKDSFMAFGQGWKTCAEEVKEAIHLMERINRERKMLVILTCHIGLHNIKNPRLGDYQRIEGDIEKPVWQVLANWADIITLADYEITVLEDKKKAISTNIRLLRCGGSVAEDTKCRAGFEIPETMPFSFDGFYMALKDTTNNALEEVRSLWPQLGKERQVAALSWLGISSDAKLATVPMDRLRILLNSMRESIGTTDTTTETDE